MTLRDPAEDEGDRLVCPCGHAVLEHGDPAGCLGCSDCSLWPSAAAAAAKARP